jgi:ankyrin repeat protein
MEEFAYDDSYQPSEAELEACEVAAAERNERPVAPAAVDDEPCARCGAPAAPRCRLCRGLPLCGKACRTGVAEEHDVRCRHLFEGLYNCVPDAAPLTALPRGVGGGPPPAEDGDALAAVLAALPGGARARATYVAHRLVLQLQPGKLAVALRAGSGVTPDSLDEQGNSLLRWGVALARMPLGTADLRDRALAVWRLLVAGASLDALEARVPFVPPREAWAAVSVQQHPLTALESVLVTAQPQQATPFVAALLRRGVRLDGRDGARRTPLFIAVARCPASTVEALLDGGADARVADARGETPLHVVASQDTMNAGEKVRLLLAARADISAKSQKAPGMTLTPLQAAAWCATGSLRAFDALLERGAPPAPLAETKPLLCYEPLDVRGTALHQAAMNGDAGMVRRLLARVSREVLPVSARTTGATPDAHAHRGRVTPLHITAEQGGLAAMRALLDAGADVRAHDAAGQGPIIYAITTFDPAAVDALIAAGAVDEDVDLAAALHVANAAAAAVRDPRELAAMGGPGVKPRVTRIAGALRALSDQRAPGRGAARGGGGGGGRGRRAGGGGGSFAPAA